MNPKNHLVCVLITVVAVAASVGITSVVKERRFNDSFSQMPVTSELMTRFLLADTTSKATILPKDVIWTDSDGYTLTLPITEAMAITKRDGLGLTALAKVREEAYSEELAIANKIFIARGFALSAGNTIDNADDALFFQGYEKTGEVCAVSIYGEGVYLTVACSTGLTETQAEQRPVLDALNFKGTGNFARFEYSDDTFFRYSVGSRGPGGAYAVLKKENGKYRVLVNDNGIIDCALVAKEKIPFAITSAVSGNDCINSTGKIVPIAD